MLTEEEKDNLCHADSDDSSMNPRKSFVTIINYTLYVYYYTPWRMGGS